MARRVVSSILSRLDEISDFPDAGAPRDHVRPGLRVVIRENYVAYYRVAPGDIVVIRVLHGSRDVEATVAEGGLDE